ncbi:ketoacyl-ACP synthase III family protein [Streptomyces fructofermentans]|uniref:Beta-ketoacyl-[acyl-carrier-protein] synthase III C-terminal domain-containing protein n=1 Tax=Streptomyces fructofermentans TaxID=152141 RepID=A0A918K3I0_9ACTN|nr:ketoacyl-ACP synthase III family protein [Streptomyces fructofermentans]GGX43953.1 hypothetical protein GCM10010515_08520 [Streptomyces fructofermentans]
MRWEQVYIAGTGTWLPGRADAALAVASGAYDADEHAANGIVSVAAAGSGDDDLAPPDMAVNAALAALDRAGPAGERASALFHSHLWFQGSEMWPAASYIAERTAGTGVPAFGLLQQCNAGPAAVELAAHRLGEDDAVLLTTADRFAAPAFDRWRCERGLVYGDGGTALVLSSRGGFGRLLSTATRADNSLERVVRGTGFTAGPDSGPYPVDLASRADEYLGGQGNFRESTLRTAKVADDSVRQALADADTRMEDVARVVLNATGRSRMRWQLEMQLGLTEKVSNWQFCSRVGHLGAGDHFAGLDDLVRNREVGPGDRVLLVGGGTGYTCTSAVVEITGSG